MERFQRLLFNNIQLYIYFLIKLINSIFFLSKRKNNTHSCSKYNKVYFFDIFVYVFLHRLFILKININ